jgi:hypothetical protein
MIRFMTELFPIVPGPSWMKNKSQPIAIQNVIDYLLAALTNPNGRGGVFEIGGPEITIYKDLMLRYARARGLKRRMFLFPGIPVWFMAFGVGLMTPVPYPIAHALIGGLSADSVVKHPDALDVFPEVKLIDFDSATRDALEKTNPLHIEPVWEAETDLALKHEGCFIDQREAQVDVSRFEVFDSLVKFAGRNNWRIEYEEENSLLLCCNINHRFGKYWVAWRWRHVENVTCITQTTFFSPHGLPGFLYWYFLHPFRARKFQVDVNRLASYNTHT